MNNKLSLFLITLTLLNELTFGHCQVPCGIYEDAVRIHQIKEDFNTIKKAMYNIKDLSKKENALSLNQSTRWINTKREHATNIQR
jgi:Nickel-containing superoxide dismutase.